MVKRPQASKQSGPADGPESEALEEARYPRRTARRKKTRAKILHAAAELFNETGYGATTMQQIADAADIHVTTLFMHFSSRNELAISLATLSTDDLRERALAAQGRVPFFEFFRMQTKAAASAAKDKSDPTMVLWAALRNDRELAFAWAEYGRVLLDIFSDYIASDYDLDRKSSYVPDLVASLLVTSTFLSHLKWASAPKKIDLAQEVQTSTDVAVKASREILKQAGV